jgi:thiopeptide-type bacteriocin biosynthesis protein
VELAERLFRADSEAVVAVAGPLAEDARGEWRWRLALVGMDRLLGDLGLDLDARCAVLRRLRDDFAREHRADASLKTHLSDKFRKEGKTLEALLDPHGCPDEALAPGLAALRRRSDSLVPIAAALRAAGLPLERLAPSYLHMHANRMLRSAQRAQEMVLYDFLHRVYESRAARGRARVQVAASPVAVGAR